MLRNIFAGIVLGLFAALSLAVSAAPGPKVGTVEHAPTVSLDAASEKVSLNTADAASLQLRLTGIGSAKAEAIVAYREANGPFKTVDELLEVKGIGSTLLERNREKLTVD
ncbi:ComEA family DNA-binding protein [Pseudomonas machongensis]